ncbi:hypothetical protein PR048_015076 [Dryococelus australis]|uniref:Uncharacterized protein n=1 Tax=Dryococelus australis TaxID=614101 RepID=A0ABQ9HGG4_9NEOP|nr:hypothetical protein PR048_015076 [Dryococelus australis]
MLVDAIGILLSTAGTVNTTPEDGGVKPGRERVVPRVGRVEIGHPSTGPDSLPGASCSVSKQKNTAENQTDFSKNASTGVHRCYQPQVVPIYAFPETIMNSSAIRGSVVVRLLASYQDELCSIPGGVSPPVFCMLCGNRAGRCRWLEGFLRDIPIPRPFIPAPLRTHLASPSSALNSQDLDVKSRMDPRGHPASKVKKRGMIRLKLTRFRKGIRVNSILDSINSGLTNPTRQQGNLALADDTLEMAPCLSTSEDEPQMNVVLSRESGEFEAGEGGWRRVGIGAGERFNEGSSRVQAAAAEGRDNSRLWRRDWCSSPSISRGRLRFLGQEARERYGRHEHARLAPYRSYVQGVQCFRRGPVLCKSDLMEQCRNEGVGETGETRENPPTSGIVRYDSHLRKSVVTRPGIEPGTPWRENRRVGSARRTPNLGNIHALPVGVNVRMKIKNCRTTDAMCHAAPCFTYLDEEAGQSL